MEILVIMIPLGLGMLALAVWAFVWAVRHGQLENLEQEGMRILLDDDDEVVRNTGPRPTDDEVARNTGLRPTDDEVVRNTGLRPTADDGDAAAADPGRAS